MEGSEDQRRAVRPTDQRGGAAPTEHEAAEKGQWAGKARDGIVPAELGGSDAPTESLPDDPQLGSSVLGAPARSEEPATDGGPDLSAGDSADAVANGGPAVPDGVEPDLKDAASGPRQIDVESAR